jgi:hypothetical protein
LRAVFFMCHQSCCVRHNRRCVAPMRRKGCPAELTAGLVVVSESMRTNLTYQPPVFSRCVLVFRDYRTHLSKCSQRFRRVLFLICESERPTVELSLHRRCATGFRIAARLTCGGNHFSALRCSSQFSPPACGGYCVKECPAELTAGLVLSIKPNHDLRRTAPRSVFWLSVWM